VEAATVWTSPAAVRSTDAPATADVPDLDGWSAALDADARRDLHGRVDTQLRRGEPARVVDADGEWVQIVAPWQPTPKDGRGYPGWVRRAHLATDEDVAVAPLARGGGSPLALARGFIGVRYLWGGLGSWGIDCSGLVHLAFRQAGVVVPRDAHAQCAASTTVPLGEEAAGDLYFFAREDGFVYHVGFATGDGQMLHAPEGTAVVEEAPISADRRRRLIGAGRLSG
jgi:cell wall-associated NlpC family hydrolase